ncbi:MAG: hypothetical protein E4G95_05865 [Bacteroidia bacterium]|nr:MAG: hypothetical protein E4G95_05865 [Bacteroidia bacterium]
MKSQLLLIFGIALLLNGCSNEVGTEYMTTQKAAEYFTRVKQICDQDSGKLWGMNLYGPVMLVDAGSRRIFSNAQDEQGILKPRDGIFTGIYPGEDIINNFAVTFGNTLFAMVQLPVAEDPYRITTRSLHGLLHCFQVKKGVDTPDYNPSHLNETTARLWVKMEWKALEKAIRTSGESREQSIRDALVFRTTRREIYPDYIEDEIRFENYEGLATFTYMILGNSDHDSYTVAMMEYLHRVYNWSYAQSFGFINGALYSYLLKEDGFDFSTLESDSFDLGKIICERLNITLPEFCRDIAGSLGINYDIDIIREEEVIRTEKIRDGLHRKTAAFTDKSVVYLKLESPSFSFEPEDVEPVDTLGVLYKNLRVSDNWGKLTVSGVGCLVSPNLQFIRIPAKGFRNDRNHISGEGWELILSSSWQWEKIDENYFVRKLIP